MQIFKPQQLDEAVKLLQNGQTLVFPTLTSYGLGCDATVQQAVNKIFKIKQRHPSKALLIVVSTIEMAKKYVVDSELLNQVSTKYWPGPLSVVNLVKSNSGLASGVVAVNNTVAVRVTNQPVLVKLISQLGKPLVATSANIAGQDNIYDSSLIKENFANAINEPDAVLDFGQLPINPPSTIIDISRGEVEVLRQGEIIID